MISFGCHPTGLLFGWTELHSTTRGIAWPCRLNTQLPIFHLIWRSASTLKSSLPPEYFQLSLPHKSGLFQPSFQPHPMPFNPLNDVTPDSLTFQISTITHRLALACNHIPDLTIDLCEETYSHGLACRKLPKDQNLRDKWVHGMIYEFVSLQQTLPIPLPTPFSIACFVRWAWR